MAGAKPRACLSSALAEREVRHTSRVACVAGWCLRLDLWCNAVCGLRCAPNVIMFCSTRLFIFPPSPPRACPALLYRLRPHRLALPSPLSLPTRVRLSPSFSPSPLSLSLSLSASSHCLRTHETPGIMSMNIVPTSAAREARVARPAPSAEIAHDRLRGGLESLSSQSQAGHPLEERLRNWDEQQFALQQENRRRVYGMHEAIRREMERQITGIDFKPRALGGPSGMHYDILTGNDTSCTWDEIYQGEEAREWRGVEQYCLHVPARRCGQSNLP